MSQPIEKQLAEIGVRPNKSLGQNFLTSPQIAAEIAAELRAGEGDTVVEVGPGMGALTEHLSGKVGRLVLVEFDQNLASYLGDRYGADESVEVHHQDAARFDLRPLYAQAPVKLIGNLPYSAGGAILKRFLNPPTPVAEAVLMLQREVAERLCASPRSKDYGRLGILVNAGWTIEPIRVLDGEPFYPRPNVDSSVIRLTRRPGGERPPFDWRIFDRLLRSGFAQRRKQLKRRLPLEGKGWDDVCAALGFSETARAEELSVEDWIELARFVDPHPLKGNPQRADEMFDVVDDEDNVIGQAPRARVHAEKLKHRAVHVFVVNPRGEIFLQKRSHLKDTAPGSWDSSAAGHLDVGESYADGAARELQEEAGVIAACEEVGGIEPCEETGWEFVRLYEASHKGPLSWPCSEVETGDFFPPEVIARWVQRRPQDFATGFLKCWELWRRRPAG